MRSTRLESLILRLQFPIWAVGFYVVSLYALLFLNTKRVYQCLFKRDIFFWLLILFFAMQVASSLLSPLGSHFSGIRFVAIFHNIIVFGFLIVGYVSYNSDYLQQKIAKYSKSWFYTMTLLCIGVFVAFFIINDVVAYPGIIMMLTGLNNGYTFIEFNAIGTLFGLPFPRSQILGLFSNSTAILIVIFYAIYFQHRARNAGTIEVAWVHILVVGALITTGSRIAIVLSIAALPLMLVTNYRRLLLVLLVGLLSVVAVFQFELIDFVLNARGASNDLRTKLYQESIRMFLSESPFTGLGLKPRPDIFYGEFPIGSHSTPLGYFTKSGMLAGILYATFHLCLIVDLLIYFFRALLARPVDFGKLRFKVLLNILFILFLFDDLDAYEPIGYFTGYLVACFGPSINNFKWTTE